VHDCDRLSARWAGGRFRRDAALVYDRSLARQALGGDVAIGFGSRTSFPRRAGGLLPTPRRPKTGPTTVRQDPHSVGFFGLFVSP
jgi:hypothetical protein